MKKHLRIIPLLTLACLLSGCTAQQWSHGLIEFGRSFDAQYKASGMGQ